MPKHTEWINIDDEAAMLWVCRCYGVSLDQLDRELKMFGVVDNAFKDWLQLERARAHLL